MNVVSSPGHIAVTLVASGTLCTVTYNLVIRTPCPISSLSYTFVRRVISFVEGNSRVTVGYNRITLRIR